MVARAIATRRALARSVWALYAPLEMRSPNLGRDSRDGSVCLVGECLYGQSSRGSRMHWYLRERQGRLRGVDHLATGRSGPMAASMRARRLAHVAVGCLIAVAVAAAPASARVEPLSLVTAPSPFSADCNGAPQGGTLYRNAEVEPHLAVNPANGRNLIAVWQQDRWSSGGADGGLTPYSKDGGRAWRHPLSPPLRRRPRGG